MKTGLRSLFLLILLLAIACSVLRKRLDRQDRVSRAVALLKDAGMNERNPVATSRALQYLRDIGIDETKDAMRQTEAESDVPSLAFNKLPFLFEPNGGCPTVDEQYIYLNGLIFDTFPSGLQSAVRLDDFNFSILQFNDRSFTPPSDLAGTCESVLEGLVTSELPDSHRKLELTSKVYSQAGGATSHLYPSVKNRYDIDQIMRFLKTNELRWNPEANRYEVLRPRQVIK